MKKILSITAMAVAAVAGLTLASCKKDDGMKHVEEQRTFSVENVMTPKKFVQSGSFKGEEDSACRYAWTERKLQIQRRKGTVCDVRHDVRQIEGLVLRAGKPRNHAV